MRIVPALALAFGAVLPLADVEDARAPEGPWAMDTAPLSACPLLTPRNGIAYHGGSVLLGTPSAYFIWYGDWTGRRTPALLTELARSLGGSRWWAINTTYRDARGNHVSGSASFGESAIDAYSRGQSIGDADLPRIVGAAVAKGALPLDDEGVYFILSSRDVDETSGFCTRYCGFHSHARVGIANLRYAFVGDSMRCPSACAPQAVSPNGDLAADGMASILAHEWSEAVTDPDGDGWYDDRGLENADKCAWTYGDTFVAKNGALANVHLGGRDWLIQQNWVNEGGGGCQLGR